MAYLWCDSTDSLRDWADGLAPDQPLYLDTEFMRERTYYPRLALVQVHDGERIRLIDTTRVEPTALVPLFAERPLIMHACSEDLEALAAFAGAYPQQVRDTQIAAALTGEDMQVGYQRLVESHMGVSLAKGATRTDWLKRPLSEEQLLYAEDDVKYLPALADQLESQLQRLGARLRDDARRRAEPQAVWRQVKGAGNLQGRELAVLEALAEWREATARQRDLPKGFVLRDNTLLDLSRGGLRGRVDLQKLGVHPRAIRRDGEALLALIEQAASAEPPAPLPGPLDPDLSLKPDVLVRRRWLEALVRDPDTLPEPLTGWRQELVARPLREML
jgi:ribonuclease D